MGNAVLKNIMLDKPRRLTAGLTDHEHPAISPDGQWLAYYAGDYGSIEVVVCDINGRLAGRISPHGGNNTQPAWHPSSMRIAYRHQHVNTAKWELWETELPSGQPRVVLADPRWHYKHPCYSPSGRLIAYFSDEGGGPFNIWVMELASGARRKVTFAEDSNYCHPVFSPDGKRIAFHAYEGTDESKTPAVTNIGELELGSGEIRWLTEGEDQYKHPFYLNDEILTFHHERNSDGLRRLSALHLPTLKLGQLTNGKANDKHPFPFISPRGKAYLAWTSKHRGSEMSNEPGTYDVFIAQLKGLDLPGKSISSTSSKEDTMSKDKKKDKGKDKDKDKGKNKGKDKKKAKKKDEKKGKKKNKK